MSIEFLESGRACYKNDPTGASAYPPAMLLKVILFAYSRGIERACREHATFIALSSWRITGMRRR